ncbi:MAG: SDR family NAD(P)-dependent oxidoreductase [Bacteroidales bacterium]
MNIIITGASRGIGLELTKRFLWEGNHKVIALSRNQTALEQIGPKEQLRYLPFDMTSDNNHPQLVSLINTFFSRKIHIVIHNAGLLIKKPFSEFSADDFDQIFAVNVKGVVLLTQRLLPFMTKPSHIVNIGSMGGYPGSVKFPGLSLYAASKGALASLSECMAEEFKPLDIFVNTLAIGAVDTDMQRQAFPGYKASVSASDMASYIHDFAINGHKVFNGKTIPVSLSTP